jgi:hypothetical protein
MGLDAIPSCKSARTISSVPADLNGLKAPNAHLILYYQLHSWPGFSLPWSFCVFISPGSAASCPSFESSVSIGSGKWTLKSSFRVSLLVWVHCTSGSLIVLTSTSLCERVGAVILIGQDDGLLQLVSSQICVSYHVYGLQIYPGVVSVWLSVSYLGIPESNSTIFYVFYVSVVWQGQLIRYMPLTYHVSSFIGP